MYLFLIIILLIIICLLLIGLHQKNTNSICRARTRLDGKTAIITGGTLGMGLNVATDFADRGARVIIACPFEPEGRNAQRLIEEETGNKQIIFKLLDLSSFKSVRDFAADILNREDRLDILVNNAGVGYLEDDVTKDGLNVILQINYYGHFLLTLLLLPLLKRTGTKSEPARVVNVSSLLHYLGTMNACYIKRSKVLHALQLYSDSKFFLMVFTRELSKKLSESNVVVNCVDPGAVGTEIFYSIGCVWGPLIKCFFSTIFKTPWEGAQTTIHVALDKKAGTISGQMFKNCQVSHAKQSAFSEINRKRLWDDSIKLVKLTEAEHQQCLYT
ncbi:retinol dehydrogenase 11-like [Danaus plexippus]|uniref:retinol dehydrogenase 11-like n=1 Tax=Danaus plexippus TaxID=13037 RepID=UPI002AB31872|nr:retinol dehydrogenase 11-like [Danaus plexippus]